MSALLIDTYSLFFRAFYGLPALCTSTGRPTGALYGFSTLLLKLLREEKPSGVALARDLPRPTFRHERFSAYKATRPALPDPLREQLRDLDQLLSALGFPLYAVEGFEADDVLATLATQLSAHERVLIVSGDRDLLQLVDDRVEVLFIGQRGKPPIRYDRGAVEARFGFPPERLPSYVALVGDTSDNLPKIPGIGEASAKKLIQHFENIDALLGALATLDQRTRAKLSDHQEQLRETELLARLRKDVPLAREVETRTLDERAKEETRALFEKWELKSLLARLAAL